MADSILIKRLAARLSEASDATPKGEGFWPTLAQIAAEEAAKPTVAMAQKPLPALPMLALGKRREGFVFLVDGTTVADVAGQVSPLFDAGQRDDVWVVEVKRIVGLA